MTASLADQAGSSPRTTGSTPSDPQSRKRASRVDRWGLGLLLALSYLPALASSRGRLAADTKAYLYLDPGRLLADSLWSWDERQFAGWVPHQMIGYLWPSGPWYWAFQKAGVPDWIAHRLWLGTILLAAGTGVRWCARRFELGPWAALTAGVVYVLSPYTIPYLSRGSILLLPWAGLGWMVGLTIDAIRRGGWRDPLLFALVVATVGGINATAMVMIAPAPLLVIADSAWRKQIRWRAALGIVWRIGIGSLGVSIWWITGLMIQGKFGAPVLAYSETLEAVSFTSVSTEVLRGLGYWITYVTDPTGPLTSASFHYELSVVVMAAGFALILLGAAGLVAVRWSGRRLATLFVLTGVVLAVGPHPIGDPPPLTSPLAQASRSTLALSLRSSTRAVPVAMLGLALGAGAVVTALAVRGPRWRHGARALSAATMCVALVNAPVVRHRALVDPVLRIEPIPAPWWDAAAYLDGLPSGYRTLQLPGTESAVARWGQTVDPILPGMTNRPVLQRDWLPTGSGPAMDLFYALDARFQTGTLDPAAIAPVARLLGADSIVFAGDVAFDKFRTPRPELTWATYLSRPDGLGEAVEFGPGYVNTPAVAMLDDRALADPRIGSAVPEVAVVPVSDPLPLARAAGASVLVVGSGDGVVSAAGAGLLPSDATLRYAAALDDSSLTAAAQEASLVVLTDSNRRQAHGWWGSQDTDGYVERLDEVPLLVDPADHRLPVFTTVRAADETVAVVEGAMTARASGYGQPGAYRPEDRPMLAIDGDAATAWRVADRADAVGQYLRLDLAEPRLVGAITLVQAESATGGMPRRITELDVRTESGSRRVLLDESSSTVVGQTIELGEQTAWIELSVVATDAGKPLTSAGFAPVGFSEVRVDDLPASVETLRLPERITLGGDDSAPIAVVLERWRTDASNRWRHDPEPAMHRSFGLPASSSLERAEFQAAILAHLDLQASDASLASVLELGSFTSTSRLAGSPAHGAWAAVDGDPGTAWTSGFDPGADATITVPLDAAVALSALTVTALADEQHSRPTELTITAGGETRVVPFTPDAGAPTNVAFEALRGDAVSITVSGVDERHTIDRRSGEEATLPVALAEIAGTGLTPVRLPDTIDSGCRDDLLRIDGTPVGIRLTGSSAAAFLGEPLTATVCTSLPIALDAGPHRVDTTPHTGFALDRIALVPAAGPPAAPAPRPTIDVVSWSRGERALAVGPCPDGCWVTAGDGWNTGWEATADGTPLGEPEVLDGALSGWWLAPSPESRTVQLHWAPQTWTRRALGVSGVALAAVLLGLGLCRRRRASTPAPAPAPTAPAALVPELASWGARRRQGTEVALLTALVGVLVIDPWWGLAAGAIAALASVVRRPRMSGLVGLGVLAGVAVQYLWHQYDLRPGAGFGWVVNAEPTHRWTLLAVVLLVAGAMAGDGPDEPLTSTPE